MSEKEKNVKERTKLETLIELLYTDRLSQYGKRELVNYIEKQQKEIEHQREQKKFWRNEFYKQQKEIEVLKSKYKDLFFQNFDLWEKLIFPKKAIEEDYISKDKIREKIKEIKNKTIGASTGIYAIQLDILEKLLEEN